MLFNPNTPTDWLALICEIASEEAIIKEHQVKMDIYKDELRQQHHLDYDAIMQLIATAKGE